MLDRLKLRLDLFRRPRRFVYKLANNPVAIDKHRTLGMQDAVPRIRESRNVELRGEIQRAIEISREQGPAFGIRSEGMRVFDEHRRAIEIRVERDFNQVRLRTAQ